MLSLLTTVCNLHNEGVQLTPSQSLQESNFRQFFFLRIVTGFYDFFVFLTVCSLFQHGNGRRSRGIPDSLSTALILLFSASLDFGFGCSANVRLTMCTRFPPDYNIRLFQSRYRYKIVPQSLKEHLVSFQCVALLFYSALFCCSYDDIR